MIERVYIRPLGTAPSPQSDEGAVVRLAGGLACAGRFAVIVRRDAVVVSREVVGADSVAAAVARLPDALAADGLAQWAALTAPRADLHCGERVIRLHQPNVMGILNVTPDSFSDGGKFLDKPAAALQHGAAMLEAGAAIIDVGGESTRPGGAAVWEGDELKRVVPVIERLARSGAAVSIDSRRVAVMEAALSAGAGIVNDVSALRHDPRALDFVARAGVPVVLMHAGEGDDLHTRRAYDDMVLDVFDWLRDRRDAAIAAGVARERIVLDVGLGFAKTLADNLALFNALPLFHALGQPLLVGASRKRMIGALSNEAPVHRRLGGSVTLALTAVAAGAQLVRVHDVAESMQALHVWRGLRDAALVDFGGI